MAERIFDEPDWTTRTPRPGEVFERTGVILHVLPNVNAVLVSGDLQQANNDFGGDLQIVGLGETIHPDRYGLRISRDRALFCRPVPTNLLPGWHESGYALTQADDLYICLHVGGANADQLISACTTVDVVNQQKPQSPSAALRFCGVTCLLARNDIGFLLWAIRSEAAHVWHELSVTASRLFSQTGLSTEPRL